MPICQNCGETWTWKQTLRAIFKWKCPHCHEKQYESASSRRKTGMFSLLPIILVPLIYLFDFSWWGIVFLFIVYMTIFFGAYPFVLKLSNEEEPFW
ncbi:TIGR04104 family putative zinc finger protein [Virgibacillus siamensis]|uniref:TIGR04104 family putative zinc finger protein n=1 Tax=Virgibacillus siamensis TaxID=480071 RepID=UPI00098791B1|nr:TIGR04104 family putative zinc finger protein [Virgibacillus siamensis]